MGRGTGRLGDMGEALKSVPHGHRKKYMVRNVCFIILVQRFKTKDRFENFFQY